MPHFPTDALIAGQWRRGAGAPFETVDPATGRVLATVHAVTADEVGEAAEAGARAAADPAWRDLLPHRRARLLYRIAELVEDAADELSAIQTADTGKTLGETRALALSAAGTFRYTGAALETAEETITPSRGEYVTMSVYEPIGVVGAINPWNSPIASDAQKIAPPSRPATPSCSSPPSGRPSSPSPWGASSPGRWANSPCPPPCCPSFPAAAGPSVTPSSGIRSSAVSGSPAARRRAGPSPPPPRAS